ncbi:hypothetical protein A9Q90_00910 [Gammaproteobacteria bacterium 54_18_T64]|nr:hypothetical protein A9Q90_00910 [Gammaproteobacteria bacterium 54_18_T64]
MVATPLLERSTTARQKFKRQGLAIYSLSCALSLLLFFAYGAIEGTLNDDGINYIYAAHALAEGLPEQAKSYRPETLFYSQITLLSSLSGLELYTSAQVLSLFWQVLLGAGFIAIVRCFDTSLPGQIIALAVFFSIANLNHLRPDIIRGFGFWALQLWAVWAGLNLLKSKAWRFALLWLGLSTAATLYRVEGTVYLLLIPLLALLQRLFTGEFGVNKGLNLVGLMIVLAALVYLVAPPEQQRSSADQEQLLTTQGFSATDKLHKELTTLRLAAENFSRLKNNIREIMPSKWAQRSVNDLLIGGFIFHLLLTIISTTNTPLLALSLYRSNIKRPILSDPQHKLLASYILIGFIVGLVSVYNKFFISQRYIMLTAILLCIPVTLLLSQTYQRLAKSHQSAPRPWKYLIFALPLLICLYPLSRQNDDKLYIQEAAHWVQENLGDEHKIYFNEQKVAFYTADYANDSFKKPYKSIESLLREGYQYAVLYGRKSADKQPLQESLRERELLLKTFQNSRGRSVHVYKLPIPRP